MKLPLCRHHNLPFYFTLQDGFAQFYNNPKARRQDINQQFWAQAYNVSVGVFTKVASLANFLMQ